MIVRSLRLRLLIGGAIAIFVALVVAWITMTILFEHHLQRRETASLTRQALQLVAILGVDAGNMPVVSVPPSDPRFDLPASGLYWQVSTTAGTVRSRSLWDQALPVPPQVGDTAWQERIAAGPFDQRVLMVERRVRLASDRGSGAIVQIAYDTAPIRMARAEFGRELEIFLIVLWVILSAAAAVQVQLGLRPLARLRHALQALRLNPAERLSVREHPPEVEPLTRAINDLADAREKDLLRARRRAADLAHALKTPLTGLAAQSRHLREAGMPALSDGLDQAIAAAAAAVESELARARAAAARENAEQEWVLAHSTVEQIVKVIECTERGAELVFEVHVPEDLRLPSSYGDLAEIAGALIENAARFARRRVRISATASPAEVGLQIEDDGPGIEERHMEKALMRGGRLDESGVGHGLGLSIARDLVEARGGSITLGRSAQLGGLQVSLRWDAPAVK